MPVGAVLDISCRPWRQLRRIGSSRNSRSSSKAGLASSSGSSTRSSSSKDPKAAVEGPQAQPRLQGPPAAAQGHPQALLLLSALAQGKCRQSLSQALHLLLPLPRQVERLFLRVRTLARGPRILSVWPG